MVFQTENNPQCCQVLRCDGLHEESRGIQDAAVAALVGSIRFIQPVDTPWEFSIAVE